MDLRMADLTWVRELGMPAQSADTHTECTTSASKRRRAPKRHRAFDFRVKTEL